MLGSYVSQALRRVGVVAASPSCSRFQFRAYTYLVESSSKSPKKAELFRNTPFLLSDSLTRRAALNSQNRQVDREGKCSAGQLSAPSGIFLKFDAQQPTGSFKDRGISHMCKTLVDEHGAAAFVTASGGNAGLAVARAGHVLGAAVHVVVPSTTKPLMLDRIRAYGAHVESHGANFAEANAHALKVASADPAAYFVPPYDHPLLWAGHSSIVDEIAADVDAGRCERPGTIVVSVGGGGLLNGVHEGLQRHGWLDTKIIATETYGADSLAQAVAGGCLVTLPAITSIATSLGSPTISQRSFEIATAFSKQKNSKGDAVEVELQVFTDAQVVSTCRRFLDDHKLLVEPACAAALSVVYENPESLKTVGGKPVAVVVCGGSGVSFDILDSWSKEFAPSGQPSEAAQALEA